MKNSDLGNRMKLYEKQYADKQLLPLIPLCARMDGKAFHTFTNGLPRPYDKRLSELMVATTRYLVEETGALIGYTQSDEISLVWYTDDYKSQTYFNCNLLKMTSVLASLTTAYFNSRLAEMIPERAGRLALFDARVWNVPVLYEAANYLLWRELDATRNSITMAAQSYYSHNALHKKSSSEKQEMLFQKGINWNDYPAFFKRGTYIQKRRIERPFTPKELYTLPAKHRAHKDPNLVTSRQEVVNLDLPPLRKVVNRTEVIFNGVEPRFAEPCATSCPSSTQVTNTSV